MGSDFHDDHLQRLTSGNNLFTSSELPSWEPLSTTMSSVEIFSRERRIDSKQDRRYSLVFQLTITMDKSINPILPPSHGEPTSNFESSGENEGTLVAQLPAPGCSTG
jgi:hypothetical protein